MSGDQWNLLEISDRHYCLLNSAHTSVWLSPSSKMNPVALCVELEELGIPIGYTRDLKEIKFTMLQGKHADYCDNVIRVSSDKITRAIVSRVFIHELAHHVDFMDDVVSDNEFEEEFKKKAFLLPDSYAQKDSEEYLAVGFEVYYTNNRIYLDRMRRENPILYRTIEGLHLKFGGKKNES